VTKKNNSQVLVTSSQRECGLQKKKYRCRYHCHGNDYADTAHINTSANAPSAQQRDAQHAEPRTQNQSERVRGEVTIKKAADESQRKRKPHGTTAKGKRKYMRKWPCDDGEWNRVDSEKK
jgi:hypothetical protein